tara:strand:- start:2884 stop:4080 length:1197 start_codon:yes stop_codon:yes gene_type:complete
MYDSPSQFEPLAPSKELEGLYELGKQITEASLSLRHTLHPTTAKSLASLLREMNSYYSNRIEGHSTHPVNIAKGLRHDFSDKPDIARLQRLAIAHIEAEVEIETMINQDESFSPFSSAGIQKIHNALYSRLSIDDRTVQEGRIVEPGEFRLVDVQVGRHVPPSHKSISAFLKRYEQFFNLSKQSWDKQLVMIACAHHRLAWVHPFLDGNGRVCRLATQAALYKYFTGGLWSVSRGLARARDNYYSALASADSPRRGDFDGRGNLSEEGLRRFCEYFLSTCLDQVTFISNMLDLEQIHDRIAALIIYLSQKDKDIRVEAILPLSYIFTSGPVSRADFKQMTGLSDKIAQQLISKLIKNELLVSDSPRGSLYFGLPLHALNYYFPGLYPEAATRMDNDSF